MSSEKYIARIAEITKKSHNVFYMRLLDGVEITMFDLEETANIQTELSNGEKFYLIVDCRNISLGHIDREVFKVGASNVKLPNKVAEAFIVNSLPIKLLLNFYLRVFKPVFPTKSFNDEASAEKWILGF